MQWHELTVSRLIKEANQTLCVEFEVPPTLADTFAFQPGQYLTLQVLINGAPVRRSYSICARLGGPLIVAIKKIDGGAFSQFAHDQLAVGSTLQVAPPDGQFVHTVTPQHSGNYLCIAAGSGITPIISIVESVLAGEPDSRISLLYGNRQATDIIFRERLLWLKNAHMTRFQWLNLFSRERQEAEVLNGRIDERIAELVDRKLVNLDTFDAFFLCGPQAMTAEVSRRLRTHGIPQSRIHCELFFASAEHVREALARQRKRAEKFADLRTQVLVRRGGREVSFELSADGENILDGAINSGLELPFSCKGGVCATCKARVVEGEVEMDVNHALGSDEVAAGYVLTCQSHPISQRVHVDFDVV